MLVGLAAIFTGTILLLSPSSKSVAFQTERAAKPKAILVELFTSEGCSSCPPADALLREINGSSTRNGQLIVGISEHVTYWNQLGWADPYSAPTYTDRQNAYANRFHLDSVYTPQMVVNGTDQFVGSDHASLQRALQHQQDKPETVAIQILSANIDGRVLALRFSAKPGDSRKAVDLFAVIADDADRTSVYRGENTGRILSHVFVARIFIRIAKLKPTPGQTIQLPLPGSFVASQPHHLILFAQATDSGDVLGVDTRPF
ncbi:DUF1223 domain-containing protein [Terriglobus saanensis]|nr:DUF1223 domain-containing protein [Terriglobus saanensis]